MTHSRTLILGATLAIGWGAAALPSTPSAIAADKISWEYSDDYDYFDQRYEIRLDEPKRYWRDSQVTWRVRGKGTDRKAGRYVSLRPGRYVVTMNATPRTLPRRVSTHDLPRRLWTCETTRDMQGRPIWGDVSDYEWVQAGTNREYHLLWGGQPRPSENYVRVANVYHREGEDYWFTWDGRNETPVPQSDVITNQETHLSYGYQYLLPSEDGPYWYGFEDSPISEFQLVTRREVIDHEYSDQITCTNDVTSVKYQGTEIRTGSADYPWVGDVSMDLVESTLVKPLRLTRTILVRPQNDYLVSEREAAALRIGMTKGQVARIVGSRGREQFKSSSTETRTYEAGYTRRSGESSLELTFFQGQLDTIYRA
jgi:hypothetical protein